MQIDFPHTLQQISEGKPVVQGLNSTQRCWNRHLLNRTVGCSALPCCGLLLGYVPCLAGS